MQLTPFEHFQWFRMRLCSNNTGIYDDNFIENMTNIIFKKIEFSLFQEEKTTGRDAENTLVELKYDGAVDSVRTFFANFVI